MAVVASGRRSRGTAIAITHYALPTGEADEAAPMHCGDDVVHQELATVRILTSCEALARQLERHSHEPSVRKALGQRSSGANAKDNGVRT